MNAFKQLVNPVGSKMKNRKIPIGISISADLLEHIDHERGDIPRSVYVVKLLKLALKVKAVCVKDDETNPPE